MRAERSYIPAAGHDLFLPFYDLITTLMGFDEARRALLDSAELRPGHSVLDVGCGTGSFVTLLKRLYPQVDVVGLDPDGKALARARRKAEGAAVSVEFVQGFSDALKYPDASFDRVFSSFMFHHLETHEKERTLREVCRVLKPGGRLHLLDFDVPRSGAQHLVSRLLYSHGYLRDNTESQIVAFMNQAGFRDAKRVAGRAAFFGLGYAGHYEATCKDS
jgi:ubiquinone/menaquinone biosynthesis C-methylase UbiE